MIIPATIQLAWWFLTRRFLKFQPMRTHYGPWQPCWISNQHQKHKSGRGPSNEHFWQVWFNSVQWFQRRRFKCEKLTDGPQMDAYPWQKLTWPMARWAKKVFLRLFWWKKSLLSVDMISQIVNHCQLYLRFLHKSKYVHLYCEKKSKSHLIKGEIFFPFL